MIEFRVQLTERDHVCVWFYFCMEDVIKRRMIWSGRCDLTASRRALSGRCGVGSGSGWVYVGSGRVRFFGPMRMANLLWILGK